MEFTIILMFIILKGSYKYKLILTKISVTFYTEIEVTIL